MRGQGGQAGQGGTRDTAAFRRMMQNNPEMRQRMQRMGRRDSAQRRNPGQQGQGQNPQGRISREHQNLIRINYLNTESMFKFFFRYFHDIEIAVESIISNKLKSMLTALGIIFGVAAVIAMLAIGKGAKQEIMEQMKMVGVNNILINPIIQDQSSSSRDESEKQTKKFSRGLSMLDVEAIRETLPSVKRISPEISFNSVAMMNGVKYTAKLVGVSNDYFYLYNLPLVSGTFFNSYQEENGIQVCIIGANIRAKFFSKIEPIGQYIKFNGIWLKVIGVLQKTNVSLTGFEEKGVNVYNDNIYIPIQTMLLRYQNRALVNTKLVSEASSNIMIIGGPGGREEWPELL